MGERLAGKIAIVTGAGSRGPGVGNGKAAAILMAREAVGRWGALDILHNNVGIESRQTLMDTTEHEWDRVMAVSLKSMLLATQAAVPALERRGGGAITCVSSVAAGSR
jgi:NAD(P)-dependent dehydrogenase (short-subunit alcohol dehydrogenase family)